MENKNEGWAKPIGCKKYHYFRSTKTVCYNGFVYHSDQFETAESVPGKCKICQARLAQQERASAEHQAWLADTDALLSFMRQFQADNGRAASLREMLEGCPIRTSRTAISKVLGRMGKDGLVESRLSNTPRQYKQWWAVEDE